MKKFSQCLLCKYVFGRTCKFKNKVISDEIYNNDIKCEDFRELDDDLYVEDNCCNENSHYYDKKE